jgi:hypothetical protein
MQPARLTMASKLFDGQTDSKSDLLRLPDQKPALKKVERAAR